MATTAVGTKWVYLFEEGNKDMRDLLGGKGAGVAEMTRAGLPVPPGFTITTECCNAYYQKDAFPEGMWEQVMEALAHLEEKTGKKFGDSERPLLVSVRSGAKFSMPGMMDTILNRGINAEVAEALAKLSGDERFALDAYRRFIQMFGKTAKGIGKDDDNPFEAALEAQKQKSGAESDGELGAADLRELVTTYKDIYRRALGEEFPEDPEVQLEGAIQAVFASWMNPRAKAYRKNERIPDDLGTAVNVQTMVFGNMGTDSGTGVAFTRDPSTGQKKLYGEFLQNAQGEDVVSGSRTPVKISELEKQQPKIYRQFTDVADKLEKHYHDMQDIEFTIERGKLYILQTRSGKRSAAAAVQIAADMVKERHITREEALMRIEPAAIAALLHAQIDEKHKSAVLVRGLN